MIKNPSKVYRQYLIPMPAYPQLFHLASFLRSIAIKKAEPTLKQGNLNKFAFSLYFIMVRNNPLQKLEHHDVTQDFSKENWWKSEAKAGLEHPTLFLNPYAYGTQGYKGCYFFLACFSQFFSVVVFLFVHRDAKDGFLFFLLFLSLFLLIFFLHAFCSKLD